MADQSTELVIPVEGMTCGGCAASVKRALERLDGVAEADVRLSAAEAHVKFDGQPVEAAVLAQAVDDAGFTVPAHWLAGR